ncbi:hypothetical protein [Microbacterium sp. NPDC058389]|uniref:hypothetical protein n=1 Tax=Microbacterium sp. NPDC058389 TaxID=3346475 RepID=UPI00365B7965
MFRTHTSVPATTSPVSLDWTIGELVAWIAGDDARCHDEALRPVLGDVAGAWRPASGLRPTSTVALVREVAAQLRAVPGRRDLRVRDLLAGRADGGLQRAPRRTVTAGVAASPPDIGASSQPRTPR